MTNISRRAALISLTGAAVIPLLPHAAYAGEPFTWTALRGDQNDFFRAPVILSGANDAILIDGSFNYGGGAAVVEALQASGKNLTMIYVTVNDPDYYFSLKPIVEAFPEARVVASSETVALIREKAQGKLDTWGPVLGEYGPQTLDDLVFPEADDTQFLELEGERVEIVTSTTMSDRRYLHVPSLNAVFGGVYVFDDLHVWTADTPSPKDRANWIAELDALIALNPTVVVAGHGAHDGNAGTDALRFTRDYLRVFEEEIAKAEDSGTLIAAMTARNPDLGLLPALEIGAQVAMGEMNWG